MAICMMIIPFLCNIGGKTGFYIATILLAIFGAAQGACEGTNLVMASAFPPKYMAAVMLGNGIAGLGTNLLRIVTLFIWPADEGENNAFKAVLSLYIFTFTVLCLCIIC